MSQFKTVTIPQYSCLLLQTDDILQTLRVHEPGVPEALVHVVPGFDLESQQPLDAPDGCGRNRAPDIVRKQEPRVLDLIRN